LLGVAGLVSLRVRGIRDVCSGQDRVVWPALSESLSAAPLYGVALGAALVPAAIAGALAWGPAAYDGGPSSVQARLHHAVASEGAVAAEAVAAESAIGRTP